MKYSSRFLVFLLLAFLPLCQSAVARGKKGECKPIRANRNKKFGTSRGHGQVILWPVDIGRYSIDRHLGNDVDTAFVYKEGKLVSSLLVSGIDVLSPWVSYEIPGQELVDTIDYQREGATGSYFNEFTSSHVVSTTNLTQNSCRYYYRSGFDSVMIFWDGNGVVSKIVRNNFHGRRDTLEYNSDGILSRKVVMAGVFTYHADGTLQSRRFDTIVSKYPISCLRDYYGDGIIKSVAYFIADTPCHIWQYYNPEGNLVQSIQKRPLSTFASNAGRIEHMADEWIGEPVEHEAELSGGFRNYMVDKLRDVLCKSRRPLAGSYNVWFKVRKDGSASFVKVVGENASAIAPFLSDLFSCMPCWRPGHLEGVIVEELWWVLIFVRPIE